MLLLVKSVPECLASFLLELGSGTIQICQLRARKGRAPSWASLGTPAQGASAGEHIGSKPDKK
jgi:hypothetical protein